MVEVFGVLGGGVDGGGEEGCYVCFGEGLEGVG